MSDTLDKPWQDVTSYSQNEKDRTPRSWRADFGFISICVTRHRDYEPDQWVMFCHQLRIEKPLASADLRHAATEALEYMCGKLGSSVKGMERAMEL